MIHSDMRATCRRGCLKTYTVILGVYVTVGDAHEAAGVHVDTVIVVIGMIPDMHAIDQNLSAAIKI
jgi:hypothetical protein